MNEWWYQKPRKINVIVDNPSWIIPHAHSLIARIQDNGDNATFISSYEDIPNADVSFYLGCIKITPRDILNKSKKNLVVHESDLPLGKGFSPLTWQILEGSNAIPICLLEMTENVDSGDIVFKEIMMFEGHELLNELRKVQGDTTVSLCLRYLKSLHLPKGIIQKGESTYYTRRQSKDSLININKNFIENFNLLRVVDNEKYPAYFDYRGCRYMLHITKVS